MGEAAVVIDAAGKAVCPGFINILSHSYLSILHDPRSLGELTQGVTRREMMTLVGASLSLAGLAGCRRPVEEIVPYVTAPEEIVPGIPRYYATTMPFGRSAYGLIVESHEGHPTKVEGNPEHPASLGGSDVFVARHGFLSVAFGYLHPVNGFATTKMTAGVVTSATFLIDAESNLRAALGTFSAGEGK